MTAKIPVALDRKRFSHRHKSWTATAWTPTRSKDLEARSIRTPNLSNMPTAKVKGSDTVLVLLHKRDIVEEIWSKTERTNQWNVSAEISSLVCCNRYHPIAISRRITHQPPRKRAKYWGSAMENKYFRIILFCLIKRVAIKTFCDSYADFLIWRATDLPSFTAKFVPRSQGYTCCIPAQWQSRQRVSTLGSIWLQWLPLLVEQTAQQTPKNWSDCSVQTLEIICPGRENTDQSSCSLERVERRVRV